MCSLSVRLPSLSITLSRSPMLYSVGRSHILFMYSRVDGHLGYAHLSAALSSVFTSPAVDPNAHYSLRTSLMDEERQELIEDSF